MEHERERLLAFQTWDSWISDLLSITATSHSVREHNAPPSSQSPQFSEDQASDKEKIACQSTLRTHNSSAKRNKRSPKPLHSKAGRSRTTSRVARRTRSSSRSYSRKRRSKVLSTIHRITRDLEADLASSSECNNCHASDADSDTDSVIFLRISELRSETNETLPRPHVSPPIPPHKLEKRHTSQVLSAGPKVTKDESLHEDLEEKERANEQKEVRESVNLGNKKPSQKAGEENGGKERRQEKSREEKMEVKAWNENEEEGELKLKKSVKQYVPIPSTTEPSAQKAEELIGGELQRLGECGEVTGLGAEDCSIRQNESGRTPDILTPQLLGRIKHTKSAEKLRSTQESFRETMNPSRSEEDDLSIQASPQLVRRWAYKASLEKSCKVLDFVGDECKSPQESQNTLDSVYETFIQSSETEYDPSEIQPEWGTAGQMGVAERPLSEHSTRAVRHRFKKRNAKRPRKHVKPLHMPQDKPECLQKHRDRRNVRHKAQRHLRAKEETDEETIAETKTHRRRAKRSRSRTRKQCKSKGRQQHRKGFNSRRMVSEFGDESEIVPVAHGKAASGWEHKKPPKIVKKNKFMPNHSRNLAMGTKKLVANMLGTVKGAVIPINCKTPTSAGSKKTTPWLRYKHEEVRHGLDRNNNAVNGKGDVKSTPNRGSETTRTISPAVAREYGFEQSCSRRSTPRLQSSIVASDFMGDSADFSLYQTLCTKAAKSPEPLKSFNSWFEPSTLSPSVSQCHSTPKSVSSKSHKLKPRRLLRRSPSFKERLEGYNNKGRPDEVENMLSIITDKYGLDLREYVQYLQVLRGRNNANRSWHLSIGANKWGQWTQREASEFEEFVCFISIDTADIDDTVLPFRVSITRHKLIARAFRLYRQSSQMSKSAPYKFVDHKDEWVNVPFASFLWLKMCQLPADHPIRRMLRSSSGPQDRRIFAIENDIDGRILLSEDRVIFVRGLPCFQVHILAPTTMAIGFALMQMEQRLPSIHAKLVITERLPMVHPKWGDRSVQAPTMGNFTTRFNSSPHLAPRITVIHAPLSATPEDRRSFASCRVDEDDPELEQIKMSQKFVDKLCTY